RLRASTSLPYRPFFRSVCPARPHELEVLGVAHRGDVGAEVFGQLHTCGADSAGRAIDDDRLTLAEISDSQAPQGVEGTVGDRSGLLEARSGRHLRDPGALPHAPELRMSTERH